MLLNVAIVRFTEMIRWRAIRERERVREYVWCRDGRKANNRRKVEMDYSQKVLEFVSRVIAIF